MTRAQHPYRQYPAVLPDRRAPYSLYRLQYRKEMKPQIGHFCHLPFFRDTTSICKKMIKHPTYTKETNAF